MSETRVVSQNNVFIGIGSPCSTSSNNHLCRICYSSNGELYSFCLCKGSIGLFHRSCLQRWIRINNEKLGGIENADIIVTKCEICHEDFKGVKRAMKTITKWRLPSCKIIDPLFMSIFFSCALLVGYSGALIARNADHMFQSDTIPSAAIYLFGLNILFLTFSFLALKKAIGAFTRRFIDINKTWYVKIIPGVMSASDFSPNHSQHHHIGNQLCPSSIPSVAKQVPLDERL